MVLMRPVQVYNMLIGITSIEYVYHMSENFNR